MNEEERPMTADDIELSGVDKIIHQGITEMLRKREIIWNGRLGDINLPEYAIDLNDGAKLFKSAP